VAVPQFAVWREVQLPVQAPQVSDSTIDGCGVPSERL